MMTLLDRDGHFNGHNYFGQGNLMEGYGAAREVDDSG